MSDLNLEIIEATDLDSDAISEFLWEAWRQSGPDSPGFAGATEEVIADIASRKVILSRLGGPTHRMFVAKQDNRVVGFASTRTESSTTIELSGVVVLKEMIGTGIGTRLLDLAVTVSAGHGFSRMVVSTESTNDRALRFYESHGFTRIGETTTDVEGTRVPVVNLTREL